MPFANSRTLLAAGTCGPYDWLTADCELVELIQSCPQLVLQKYLAIVSWDSGALRVDDAPALRGWTEKQDVAYGPQVHAIEELPTAGYDEWYVFDSPCDIGTALHTNIFEAGVQPGQVLVFVNYFGFALHRPEMNSLVEMFWKQLEMIGPESWVGESGKIVSFATRDKGLFSKALSCFPPANSH